MVMVGLKWIFDVERVIFQPWSGWGDRKSARTLRGYTLVIFPPKIISWRKKYGGVKNSNERINRGLQRGTGTTSQRL